MNVLAYYSAISIEVFVGRPNVLLKVYLHII